MLFPQAEHARLAGTIALAWGNDRFERPPVPFAAFVRGVALHDRGYDEFDADGIGEVPPERWFAIQLAGYEPRRDEPVADLIVALHLHRLVGNVDRRALSRLSPSLSELAAAAGIDEADAAEADRVTDLCDRIAFDFCFEERRSGSVCVAAAHGADAIAVTYAVDGDGGATLAPWPLAPAEVIGLVLGYRADGYPGVLDPVVVPFHIRPG